MNSKKMMTLILSLLILGVTGYAAGAPGNQGEIPLMSGAVQDKAFEEELQQQFTGEFVDGSLRNESVKGYAVKANIEDVVLFYVQKLGAREDMPQTDYREVLKPGQVSAVWFEKQYYEPSEFTDQKEYDTVIYPGKWVLATLQSNRKAENGQWVKSVNFGWCKKEANSDFTQFNVVLDDAGFDFEIRKYQVKTSISIITQTFKSETAMEEEVDQEIDRKTEAKKKQLMSKPPTEQDLGVPIYPGAIFNLDATAGMSIDNDQVIYIFMSNDPPAKVVGFYEVKLSKKATATDKDSYLIPLKGQMPIPDEGIAIQSNTMFGGSAKTVISIAKQL